MHDLKINDIVTALKIKNSPMGLTRQSGEQKKLWAITNYCLLPLGLVCRPRQLPRARLKKDLTSFHLDQNLRVMLKNNAHGIGPGWTFQRQRKLYCRVRAFRYLKSTQKFHHGFMEHNFQPEFDYLDFLVPNSVFTFFQEAKKRLLHLYVAVPSCKLFDTSIRPSP